MRETIAVGGSNHQRHCSLLRARKGVQHCASVSAAGKSPSWQSLRSSMACWQARSLYAPSLKARAKDARAKHITTLLLMRMLRTDSGRWPHWHLPATLKRSLQVEAPVLAWVVNPHLRHVLRPVPKSLVSVQFRDCERRPAEMLRSTEESCEREVCVQQAGHRTGIVKTERSMASVIGRHCCMLPCSPHMLVCRVNSSESS